MDPCRESLFHDSFVTSTPAVLPPDTEEGAESSRPLEGLQMLSAQLMCMQNGIWGRVCSRVAYFNNTKQIAQKCQRTRHPEKSIYCGFYEKLTELLKEC